MSGFSGRRGPNVSQYIANLNTIPSAHDIATQQQEGFNLEDDLAIFTNAEFFDFDLGENLEQSPVNYNPAQEERARRENAAARSNGGKGLDFVGGNYQYPELSTFDPTATTPTLIAPQPLQTTYPPPLPPATTTFNSPTSPFTSIPQVDTTPNPNKRKLDAASLSLTPHSPSLSIPDLEASSRVAAEEDKRRRNTAASARFRVKKKQREQALERTTKALTDKNDALEARITQLELENKWLRNLVVDKNNAGPGKDDVAELWRKFTKENEDARSLELEKKGVGTGVGEEGGKSGEEKPEDAEDGK